MCCTFSTPPAGISPAPRSFWTSTGARSIACSRAITSGLIQVLNLDLQFPFASGSGPFHFKSATYSPARRPLPPSPVTLQLHAPVPQPPRIVALGHARPDRVHLVREIDKARARLRLAFRAVLFKLRRRRAFRPSELMLVCAAGGEKEAEEEKPFHLPVRLTQDRGRSYNRTSRRRVANRRRVSRRAILRRNIRTGRSRARRPSPARAACRGGGRRSPRRRRPRWRSF